MFARALIVLLAVANLGVALWWALQPAPSAHPVAAPSAEDAGVPRLRLLHEPAAPAAPASLSAQAQGTPRCYAFGPFDAAGYAAARARLQPLAQDLQLRADEAAAVRGWRVWLPSQPDRAAANALAARIAAAGFRDLFVMPDGGEPNAIALGRFGSEASAGARAQALQAAGFPARAEPLLSPAAPRWLDVRVDARFDADAQRLAVAAPQAQPLDCTRLPAAAR
ncbi:MAG TPA: SPOR domain-containing protein [Xanthomonadaceae bacterium]|nr:SPOR domain-containing protein [Xanthomonadaceae bacterium]